MNKLWTFGDSFTAGILPDAGTFKPYIEYLDYLNMSLEDCPEGWGFQLAKKLNAKYYETHSIGGASNAEIFNNISKHSHKFKRNDIVIINWTYLHRFMWGLSKEDYKLNLTNNSYPYGKFIRASLSATNEELLKYADYKFYDKLAWNRSLSCWIDEILNFENIIDALAKSVKFQVYYWSAEHSIHTNDIKNLFQRKYICHDILYEGYQAEINDGTENIKSELFLDSIEKYGATSIYTETNGSVWDRFHRGIKGNEVQAELFYSWITNEKLI